MQSHLVLRSTSVGGLSCGRADVLLCATVDDKRIAHFDATPWFEQADAQSIVLLAQRDWAAPWVADAPAWLDRNRPEVAVKIGR